MSTTIAFIGLGNMGAPMAENLLKAGYPLKVHDINLNAIHKLTSQGAGRGREGKDGYVCTGCVRQGGRKVRRKEGVQESLRGTFHLRG